LNFAHEWLFGINSGFVPTNKRAPVVRQCYLIRLVVFSRPFKEGTTQGVEVAGQCRQVLALVRHNAKVRDRVELAGALDPKTRFAHKPIHVQMVYLHQAKAPVQIIIASKLLFPPLAVRLR